MIFIEIDRVQSFSPYIRGSGRSCGPLLPATSGTEWSVSRESVPMDSDEFEERLPPDWYITLLEGDGQEWSEYPDRIQGSWDALRLQPSVKRALELALLSRQLEQSVRSEAKDLDTSMQDQKRRLSVLQFTTAGTVDCPKPNSKKKRTVDDKLDAAYDGCKADLIDLTPLQKKRVLKRLMKKYL